MRLKMVCLGLASLMGCDSGSGTLEFLTYGEDFIEQGIPAASAAEPEGFVDGASARFTRFLVVLADVRLSGPDGEELDPDARVFDLTRPGPHPVRSLELAAARWPDVGVTVRPDPAPVAGVATTEDVALMRDRELSIYAEGEVTLPAGGFTFRWGFSTQTRYDNCAEDGGAEGVVVPDGGRATAEFTVHGDHFFYDDLQSGDPSLRAEALAAADANGDGEVSLAELETVELDTLPLDRYGTGGDVRVTNLRQFLEALTQSLVHFQGEGECRQVRLGPQ